MDKSACMRWGSVPGIWNLKAGEAALACGADAVSRLLAHGAGEGKARAQGSHLRLLRQCLKETRVRRANYDECVQLYRLGKNESAGTCRINCCCIMVLCNMLGFMPPMAPAIPSCHAS
jgi:hypothetical protein